MTIPSCRDLVTDRSLTDILREVNGLNFAEPTPESLLGRYLAESGADSRLVQLRTHGHIGQPILAVAVSAQTFPLFQQIFANFPNLMEQVHPPNFYINPMPDFPNVWHFWFRRMNMVYDYILPEGFRESGEWRFSSNNLGPVWLLSDSETRRFEDYLQLTSEPHTTLRYPHTIAGFNYPVDAYSHHGNCTACFFHAPIGDETVNVVTSPGNNDVPHDHPERAARTAALQNYVVPPEFAAQAELMQRVWNPNLNTRLMDLLQWPAEEGLNAGGSWVAYGLTIRSPRERSPFLIVYTDDHLHLPAEITELWDWQHVPGNVQDLAVDGENRAWVISTDGQGGGFGIYHQNPAGAWDRVPGGAVRISVGGNTLPWVVNENWDIYEMTPAGWVNHPGKAADIAVSANGEVWIIGSGDNGGGGHHIFRRNGDTWQEVGGAAVRIAIDASGVAWVVNKPGSIFKWTPGGWAHVPGPLAEDIAVSPTGTPWITGRNKVSGGSEIFYYNGDRWVNVPGGGTNIAVGPDGAPWHANISHRVFRGIPATFAPAP